MAVEEECRPNKEREKFNEREGKQGRWSAAEVDLTATTAATAAAAAAAAATATTTVAGELFEEGGPRG
ncbi:hypothetical protein HZH68_009496 [Vespula germanica]|uniref:Uncharacterized protein n=1 Tax=Vespula germanica TaxID=30212 RepID=A0A834K1E9_VESGE|nr:hypothetical protein HZH68_009496 [Vespula germanica]